jgi:hypothetical protein
VLQGVAQLAAIRELLEAEHEVRVVERLSKRESGKEVKPWPPAGSAPLSEVG